MKTIYLVRHEESEANADVNTVTATTASIRLTSNGKNKAKAFADTCDVRADLVIVSPYLRTQETALPYIDKNAITQVEIWNTQEFTYLQQARYNGTTTAERKEATRAYWHRLDIYYKDGDDCESFNEFVDRVLAVRSHLLARTENTILLFSHGYFIQAFLMLNGILSKKKTVSDIDKLICFNTIAPRLENSSSKIKSSTLYPVELLSDPKLSII